eukprot:g28435.t1
MGSDSEGTLRTHVSRAQEQLETLRPLLEGDARDARDHALDRPTTRAAQQFREAVVQLQRRSEERIALERRRNELEASLQEILHRAEDTETSKEENIYQELQQRLSETSQLPLETQRSLEALKSRGDTEKRSMDETAQQLQQKLRAATISESCEPEILESTLQERYQHGLAMAEAKRVMKRMEDACEPSCSEECQSARLELNSVEKRFEEQLLRQKKQVDAKEKLKHSHTSGDPDCLEGALQEAQDHGLEEEHLLPAQARLRELRTAERQVQKAIETADRVHLTAAVEEAGRQGLKTALVDEALQKLQSSKTGNLIAAIRERDYHGLKNAIAEAESRKPHEVAEVADVLSQAKDVHETLDTVAKDVSAALRTMKFEDLQRSVKEAAQHKIVTEDVKKAEGPSAPSSH